MAKITQKRVDVFADEHIGKGAIVNEFLSYCKDSCGWAMDEEHDEESLLNALKAFVRDHLEIRF